MFFFWVSQLLGSFAPGALTYTGVRLELYNGFDFYSPAALAEDGRAGGYVRVGGSPLDVAVVWDHNGIPAALEIGFPYQRAYAIGFDRAGIPLGVLHTPTQFPGPAGHFTSTGFVPLPDPGNGGAAFDGNGTITVGLANQNPAQAVIWDSSGYHLLPVPRDGDTRCVSINLSGVYVGNGAIGFIGQGGSAAPLAYPNFAPVFPFEITDSNWITGVWFPQPGQHIRRGFLARAFSDEIYDLGVFPGYVESYIGGINNDNTIVGAARNGGDYEKALIWPNGSLVPQDLNLMVDIPGVTLIRGIDINNAGQILAEGFSPTANEFSYYVLTPVPEAMGTTGVVCSLIFCARGRRAARRPSTGSPRMSRSMLRG